MMTDDMPQALHVSLLQKGETTQTFMKTEIRVTADHKIFSQL